MGNKLLSQTFQLLIDGKWQDAQSGKTLECFNPATGEVISRVAEGREEDINLAVQAARKAFDGGPWRKFTPSDREKILHKIADLIESNLDQLAELESLNNGMLLSQATMEITASIGYFRYMAGWPTKLDGQIVPTTSPHADAGDKLFSYVTHEPVGVVGQIIPWNAPMMMASWKIGQALAAGCTVVLKPAEQTPLTALRLGEILLEAGVPDGVVNIIPGFGATAGEALAKHMDIDKAAFTGSVVTGKKIIEMATTNLKRVSLELGGKSPNIIFNDADLDKAIPAAAEAIFARQGQSCSAGSRLFGRIIKYRKIAS